MFRRTISLSLIGLLAACSQAPEYVRPALSVPTAWPGLSVGSGVECRLCTADPLCRRKAVLCETPAPPLSSKTSLAAAHENWRDVFLDTHLQSTIAAALEHNRDLAISVFRVDEARAQAGIARAPRLPELDLNAQHQSSGTSSSVARNGFATTSQRYDVGVGVAAFELDFWDRLRNLDDAARANFLSTEYARSAFRLSLIRDVAQTWFSVRELSQRKELAEQTMLGREASLNLITHRRDVGLASDIDFQTATGALANARVEIANLARQLAAAENGLQLLVGQKMPDKLSPAPTDEFLRDIAVGLPAEVLLARPDILAAEQKLIAANANVGAARTAFFPRILLTASAGSASSALSNLFAAGSGTWSFVPALTVPLFDGGRNQDNLDIAEARKNIAVAEYEKSIQSAFRDVANLLAARTHYLAQIEALQAGAQAQIERLRLVNARYVGGVANHLELIDAQRDSFAAQQNLLIAKQQALSTSASMFAALGGY